MLRALVWCDLCEVSHLRTKPSRDVARELENGVNWANRADFVHGQLAD